MSKTTGEKKDNKTGNTFQWMLFAIIPLLVAVIAVLIISMTAGVNIFEKAREVGSNLPVISKLTNNEVDTNLEEQIIELQGQVRDREALINQLQSEIEKKETEIDKVKLEKEQVEKSVVELELIQDENKRAFKDIVTTYEKMSPKRAAPIIAEMQANEALQILANVKADVLSAILEKMEPKDAARFTEMLTSEKNLNNK